MFQVFWDERALNAPEYMSPGQSSSAEPQHKRQQHWCCYSSCKLPICNFCLLLLLRPSIPPEPERITAAVFLVLTDVELVWPQCCSLCVLQEAVVQAAVKHAVVGDHQGPVMVHKNRVQFTVETRGLELSEGGVPVLDHTYTWKEEQLQVSRYRAAGICWWCDSHAENEIKRWVWLFNFFYYNWKDPN